MSYQTPLSSNMYFHNQQEVDTLEFFGRFSKWKGNKTNSMNEILSNCEGGSEPECQIWPFKY